ncbi:GNAT family N-acetyltransferase [Moheibacter lacus]|uniref:GNAT family N-acetyltransferase n=1 Tax=Moheibacter lacus TaxID=2745851 RepID=A0A838ZSE8_9FLAO|nr:GNAT family N-acetyltransferase [Moheibacter lacus]MBA5629639.1 GNAT family N-acetyltransferase [Moheibacter lacus]
MNYSKLPPEDMIFETAVVEDIDELSAVAIRSKRHWGYSKEAMELWNQNLTITEDFLNAHTVIKATLEDEIVGFFALEEIKPTTRIAQYWIDTPYMRKGYGSVMYDYLRDYLKKRNVEKVTLVLDPNGIAFFEKKGATILSKIEHKVKNKFLYIVEVPV